MTDPLLYPHVTGIIDRLESVTLPNGTPVPIGNHRNVLSSTGKIVAPSIVLYMRIGGSLTGSVARPQEDGLVPFQLTCIGVAAEQAFALADYAHTALKAAPILVADRKVTVRRSFLGARAERDEQVSPPLYYVTPEYRLITFPSVEES